MNKPNIIVSEKSLILEDSSKSDSIVWNEIIEVTIFKRDCFVVDLICMELKTSKEAFEVNEEMNGWKSLYSFLPKKLSGCKQFEDWFSEVAFPAFETNKTIIYNKSF